MRHSSKNTKVKNHYGTSASRSKKTRITQATHNSSNAAVTKALMPIPDAVQTLQSVLNNNDALRALLTHFGGCTIHIPMRITLSTDAYDKHPLVSLIGHEYMVKLIKHYGGTELYIPKCQKYLQHMRNNSIIQSFSKETQNGTSSGKAVQGLAKKYGLSDRRIWSILKLADTEKHIHLWE